MRTFLILAVVVCLFALVTPAVQAQSAADEAAVRKANEQMLAALNMHDAKAIGKAAAALATEDSENWDGTVKGRAATEKYLSEELFAGQHLHIKRLEEIGIVFVTPDVAIYKGRTEWTGWVDEDGKSLPPIKSLDATVYVKKSGKWLQAAYFWRPIEE